MSGELRVVIPGCSRPYWIHCFCDDLMNELWVRLLDIYIYIIISPPISTLIIPRYVIIRTFSPLTTEHTP